MFFLAAAPQSIRWKLLVNLGIAIVGFIATWGLEALYSDKIGFGEGMNSIASLNPYRHFYAAGPRHYSVGVIFDYGSAILLLLLAGTVVLASRKVAKTELSRERVSYIRSIVVKIGLCFAAVPPLLCIFGFIGLVFGQEILGQLQSFYFYKALQLLAAIVALVGAVDIGFILGGSGTRGGSGSSTAG